VITILPKLPSANDEYTPAQRRVIDCGIAKGLDPIEKGRAHGPFETADEAIAHLRAHSRRRKKTAKPRLSKGSSLSDWAADAIGDAPAIIQKHF
jgi:hypothetical protein